jgi:aminopeptidase
MLGAPDVDGLWELMTPMLRLDAPDPERAWREHIARLQRRAEQLQQRDFTALRFRGGGTDLTVGLLAGARWMTAALETTWGAQTVVNMPSEEVFTTPDHRRTEGVVRATRPVHLDGLGRVEGLTIRFERGPGRADRRHTRRRPGARADGHGRRRGPSRRGRTGRRLIARRPDRDGLRRHPHRRERHKPHRLGQRLRIHDANLPADKDAQEAMGFNRSDVHQDAMIGGREVDIFGVEHSGAEIPVIAADAWVLT